MTRPTISVKVYQDGLRSLDGCDSDEAVNVVYGAVEKALNERYGDKYQIDFEVAYKHESGRTMVAVWGDEPDENGYIEDDVRDLIHTASSEAIGDGSWLA
jgi:hypothetical protein